MFFIEEFARLTLFFSLHVLSESSKTCYFRTVFTLLLSTMVSMSHSYCVLLTNTANSSFIMILSESKRGCLIWIKFVEIPRQKFISQLNVINPFSIL